MQQDELGAWEMAGELGLMPEMRRRLEDPGFGWLPAVMLPLQVLQQSPEIGIGMVAIGVADPFDIARHLVIAVWRPGAERRLQQVDLLFRLLRLGVVRLADRCMTRP